MEIRTSENPYLRERNFFVGNRYSIADIALYAYTHVADEGGFDLGRFPAIAAWIERVRNQPGHVPDNAGLSGGGHEPEDAHGLRTLRGRPRRRRASFHLQLRVHFLRELRNQYGTRLFELLRGAGAPAQTPIRGNVGA